MLFTRHPMRVLHFGRFHNENFGGLERVVAQLLKGLAQDTRFTWRACAERTLIVYREALQAASHK